MTERGGSIAGSEPHGGMTRLLAISGVLTLVGLALMAWSMLQPTWMPVMLAMTVGQLVGTTAFAIYLYVVVRDFRRSHAVALEAPP
jgi:uncharacterized protein (DUF2062 family)